MITAAGYLVPFGVFLAFYFGNRWRRGASEPAQWRQLALIIAAVVLALALGRLFKV